MPDAFWQESYAVFKKIPELKVLKLETIDPLTGWIQGKDYKELADLYFNGKTETVVTKLEKVIYAFSWGFNSLIRHLDFYLNGKSVPDIFANLTALTTNGVPTVAAVYAISLGVHNRQMAITLSNFYQSLYPSTEYSTFKEWIFNLDFSQWTKMLETINQNSHEIEETFNTVQQKQRSLRKKRNVFRCSLINSRSAMPIDNLIDKDELIVVRFNEDLWITTYDYQKYWQLGGEDVEKLKQLDRQVYDFLVDDIDGQKEIVSISVH